MTKYRLAKSSGVPQATVTDICSGKAKLENCSAGTVYKLALALGTTVEALIETRPDFEIFKSTVCHRTKELGDIKFLFNAIQSDEVRRLYNKHWHLESLYLLAMVDYLSRENNIPLCTKYNDLRNARFRETVYPSSVTVLSIASSSDQYKQDSLKDAIPEFLRHNIVEAEVRNVY